jgi:ketosteroid isomerase-like protein
MRVRLRGVLRAGATTALLALAACSSLRREERPAPPPPVVGDVEAINAEARRILQDRSFARLKDTVRAAETAAILATLDAQAAAWNRGDLETFMAGYWRSPDLSRAAGSTPVRGWAEALRRYRSAYPERRDMGALTFSEIDIEILAPDAATVFGRWRLAQASETPAGLFTLVLRKIDGRWLIVHDHTSSGV